MNESIFRNRNKRCPSVFRMRGSAFSRFFPVFLWSTAVEAAEHLGKIAVVDKAAGDGDLRDA